MHQRTDCGSQGPRRFAPGAPITTAAAHPAAHSAAYDAAHDGCFGRCPGFKAHGRNTSSACWIYCLFATVNGRDAMVPGGHTGQGMPVALLESAFSKPFDDVSAGGCPAL